MHFFGVMTQRQVNGDDVFPLSPFLLLFASKDVLTSASFSLFSYSRPLFALSTTINASGLIYSRSGSSGPSNPSLF
jgi:hypothetical protein